LLDILKTFSEIPLTFTISEETQGVEISAGEGKYKLSGHNGEDYPKVPEMDAISSVNLPSRLLASAIVKTVFAAGTDELRPVMTGVFCEITPEDITFVATDAHKLVRYKRTDVKSEISSSFILPKKPLNQLKNQLMHEETDVKVNYNTTNASFTWNNFNLICRLIDGRFPNYEAVIPTLNPNILTIERLPFLSSIKRVAIFANQSTHQIRLKMSGKELMISAEDVDYSNEAKERLTCNYEGEDMEIGFNSRFMIEMINNVESEEIRIEMSQPNRAGILLPVEKENSDENILMLVMPVMLNQ
jgi:DNA polymerase-3 subunit beta